MEFSHLPTLFSHQFYLSTVTSCNTWAGECFSYANRGCPNG